MQIYYTLDMGGSCSCDSLDYLRGDVDIIYEDTVLRLNQRPQTYHDLMTAVLQIVPAARSEHDLILEYAAAGEVGRILSDLSLFEAYILARDQRAVIGVKLTRFYVPTKADSPLRD